MANHTNHTIRKNPIMTALLVSVLLLAGAFAFTGCGESNTGSDGEEPTTPSAEEQKPDSAADDAAWKAAYREILEANEEGIRNYEDPEGFGETFAGRKGTALCDLDEDGTPELLFMESEEYPEVLHIYSYKNGEAGEWTYPWTRSVAYEEESTKYDRMSIAQVAGGSDYVVYKEKGVKGFTTYSTITDMILEAATNRYEIGDAGDIDRISLLGMRFSYEDEDSDGKYGPEYAEFYDTYNKISREEYEKTMNASVDAMDTVLFRFERLGEEVDVDTYKADNNPALWEKARGKEISIRYDEMLQKLPAAEENEPDAKTADAVSDDGKNMEALLDAYGKGDFAKVEEINGKLPETVSEMEVSEEEADAYEALHQSALDQEIADEYTFHFITDIDKDGKAEYLLQTGTCEADYMLTVYQYRDGASNFVGEVGFGHSYVCQYPDHNGIIIVNQHMDGERLSVVTLENGELKEKDVLDGGRETGGEAGETYLELGCRAAN